MIINNLSIKKRTYDAIVIGSGISGGWAAKELCEKGLKTLVLERGRNVEHISDYPTALTNPWEFPHRNRPTQADIDMNPIQSKCYAFNEGTEHFFVNDSEHPYIQVKPFNWIRGYQVGGRSLTWGRQCYRWGKEDFEANAKDGFGVDWPIRYEEIAPWYSYVEKFVGISGNKDNLSSIPDGEFLPPMEMTCMEEHFRNSIKQKYENRNVIIGRAANLTERVGNRGPCQYRNLCHRGCPFSGYFSSQSATLPAANATSKMTLLSNTIVHTII
ncbi:MAG: GMC family oxidoreductase, partial [Saprospiraceae bacterium]|nr:GMC family oxidoreductase [Saprospiraceae bacterium]